MATVTWNYDKPHRCPQCHRTWTYRTDFWFAGITPRWWKTYICQFCDVKFTGRWAWLAKHRDAMRLGIRFYVRWLTR